MYHRKYRLAISSLDSGEEIEMVFRGHHTLCGSIPRIGETNPEIADELWLRGITLSDRDGPRKVEFLIGADMYPYIITSDFIQLQSGVTAIKTKLGWTVLGQTRGPSAEYSMANMHLTMPTTDAKLVNLWELEAIGISDQFQKRGNDEIEVIKLFERNMTRLADGRYSVRLPWKTRDNVLPRNRDVALARLQKASKKLMEMNLYTAYAKIFLEWEQEGFIEKVEGSANGNQIHYVPHRPVVKVDSLTTPVRPVFDASFRAGRKPALNDILLKGENYIKLIPEILLRFREKTVAFVSDIRKAFQMIEVHPEHRNVMRFLWWQNQEMGKIIEYRHKRVMFGATCSPYILGAVLQRHLNSLPEAEVHIGRKLLSTLYVDNCVSYEDCAEDYYLFREKSIAILQRAQMELRMWLSNIDGFEDPLTHTVSVLGLEWDRRQDTLYINFKAIVNPQKITKRSVLSTVQKLFDPIGYSCPAILPMKILLQRTWLQKLGWDEELMPDDKALFVKWMEDLPNLRDIRIPRLATNGTSHRKNWSLRTFGDACDDAYAAVVFLRVDDGKVSVQLLGAKSRVAPVKIEKTKSKGGKSKQVSEAVIRLTIPKLELMACNIGAKLAATVKEALELQDVPAFFWSDSTTALAWIKRGNQWGTFVANRVSEIHQRSDPRQWHHVPGSLNPADLPSRGCSSSQLFQSKWWEGPEWLYHPRSHWPCHGGEENEEEIDAERRKSDLVSLCVVHETRCERSYLQLVRIVGWARRFLHNCRRKNVMSRRFGELSEEEVKEAEFVMIRNIQKEEYADKMEKKLSGLEVFSDSWGVCRTKTRLTYRDDCDNFKYPMILPGQREETRRLIRDVHRKNCHAGVGTLMTILRKEYWITKARKTIKSVLRRCFRCRRAAARPCVPQSAPLPLNRVGDAEVFQNIGVDLKGPITLIGSGKGKPNRDGKGTRKETEGGRKVWLVIFTCAIYRAVHFEIVDSLTSKAFIRALGRFIRKFRRPAIIYSDNGTNFRGTANLFAQLDWDEIKKHFDIKKIKFKFIPALAPWYGGWWERLIRTASELIRRTVGNAVLKLKELESVVASVADVMNQRPLTYVSEEINDLEPLTPAMFLHPYGSVLFPEGEMSEADKLRFRFRYVNTLRGTKASFSKRVPCLPGKQES